MKKKKIQAKIEKTERKLEKTRSRLKKLMDKLEAAQGDSAGSVNAKAESKRERLLADVRKNGPSGGLGSMQ